MLQRHGLPTDETLREAIARQLQRRTLEALIEALQKENTREVATWSGPPPLVVIQGGLSASADAPVHVAGPVVGLTVSQAFEAWRDYSKGRSRKPQLVQEWDLAVRRFVAMFGDIDMDHIRPQMVRDFREKLLELPGRTKKSIKALPLDNEAAVAANEGLPTLAPATVNKALSALRSITEHVIDKMSKVPLQLNAAKQAKFVEVEES